MARLVEYLMDRGPCKGEARPAIVVSENEDGERAEDVVLLGNEVMDAPEDAPEAARDEPVAVNEPGGNEDGGKQAARINKRRGKQREEGPQEASPAEAQAERDADGGRRIAGTLNLVVFCDRDKDNFDQFVVYRANVSQGDQPGNYR